MEVPAGVSPSPIRSYLGVVQRRFWVIFLVAVVVMLPPLVFELRQDAVYEASGRVLLQKSISEQLLAGDQSFVDTRNDTDIEVMQSQDVKAAVDEALGHAPSISLARVGTTTLVTVTATAGSPQQAATDATTFSKVYVKTRKDKLVEELITASTELQKRISDLDGQLKEVDAPLADIDNQIAAATKPEDRAALQAQRTAVESRIGASSQSITTRRASYASQLDRLQFAANTTVTGGAQVVTEAVSNPSAISPHPLRAGLTALGVGLAVGLGLAFLFEQLDDSIRSKSQLEMVTRLATVGLIPSVPEWKRSQHEVVSIGQESSSASEAYKSLRTSVQFMGIERTVAVIQVTSALPSEGKTTTVGNLGVALARAGKRVVLVDSDLRRPRLHQLFGLSNDEGLTSVLLGDKSLADAVIPVPGERRLAVLPSGPVPPNPSELLIVRRYAQLIETLRSQSDYVIIDTPPVLPVADARIVAGVVDATLLVVAANASAEKDIKRSLELLQQVDANIVGTVLNDIPSRGRYSYGYGYWYSYGAKPSTKFRRRHGRYRGPKPTSPRVDAEDVDSRVTAAD
ncbi:MAG: polysaccharide biosynthesis tyrosine autokinase [Acidimicrobiales bacterium]